MARRFGTRWFLLSLLLIGVFALPLVLDRMSRSPGSTSVPALARPTPTRDASAPPRPAPEQALREGAPLPPGAAAAPPATIASAKQQAPTQADRVATPPAAGRAAAASAPRDGATARESMRELPPQAERSEPKAERAPGGGLASGAASSAYVPFPRGGTPSTTEAPPASTGSGSESTPDGETTPGGSSSQPSTGGSRPGPTEPPASNPAIVRMLAEATEVSVGAPVTIHVAIADASDVGSVPFHVLFDPAVLQYQRSEEGAFLQSGGRQTVFAALPTGRADSVIVGLAKLGRGDGVDGVGELCTLHFTAVGPGAADLRFERANVRDSSNRILQSSFLPVSVTVH